jgi:hypothetical protein
VYCLLVFHVRGLFTTRKMALSTTLVWLSWLLIGLAYPLYCHFASCEESTDMEEYFAWGD